jgi:hypothetical protein
MDTSKLVDGAGRKGRRHAVTTRPHFRRLGQEGCRLTLPVGELPVRSEGDPVPQCADLISNTHAKSPAMRTGCQKDAPVM